MKKLIGYGIAGTALIFMSFSTFSCSKVPAGYRGVIVNMYGSSKGVSETSVGVGRYWMGWNREMYLFPTFLQNYTWVKNDKYEDESITMQTSEGLSINTDAGITYSISPDNVVKVFQKYRLGVHEITNTFLRNMVRDAMNEISSHMTIEQIYGDKKSLFLSEVNKLVKDRALADGIEVDKIYIVGSFRLPESVVESINSKIQASQNAIKVENEVATARAEAQKTIVQAQAHAQQIMINADSQAKANKELSASLTPEFIRYKAIEKWDGQLPRMNSNAIPFISTGEIK